MTDPRPDGDRLPWLEPVGPRKAAAGPRAAIRGLIAVVVLLTIALAGTLSLLLLRERASPPTGQGSAPTQIAKVELPAAPVPRPAPALPPVQPPAPIAVKPAKIVPKARPGKRVAPQPKVRTPRNRRPPATSIYRRGRMVQLGAFNSPRQADIAWRSAARDYAYLATLPKLVRPVRVGPRRRLYYRLQLRAPSPRHAVLICRAVHAMKRACIVA